MLASSQSRPSPVPFDVRQLAIHRCTKEQEQIIREVVAGRKVPTVGQCLGYLDWEMEKALIAHVEGEVSGEEENSGEAKLSC